MYWEHRGVSFSFDSMTEFNQKLIKWSEAGWEAVSSHLTLEVAEGEQFYGFILFKRMKPIQLTGDID